MILFLNTNRSKIKWNYIRKFSPFLDAVDKPGHVGGKGAFVSTKNLQSFVIIKIVENLFVQERTVFVVSVSLYSTSISFLALNFQLLFFLFLRFMLSKLSNKVYINLFIFFSLVQFFLCYC